MEAFNVLQRRANMLLEDPMLTELHTQLVRNGNFGVVEDIMTAASEKDLFRDYIRSCSYKPEWRKIEASNAGTDSATLYYTYI
jgi:hypothetical protein